MTQEQPKDAGGAGGVGGSPDKATRWEQRQHLRVLEEAVYNGWQIPAEAAASLPREVLAIATDPNASPRDRIRATELLAALRKADIEAAVNLDRILRLDAGTATENLAIVDLPDEALAAVARSLVAPKPCPPRRKPK